MNVSQSLRTPRNSEFVDFFSGKLINAWRFLFFDMPMPSCNNNSQKRVSRIEKWNSRLFCDFPAYITTQKYWEVECQRKALTREPAMRNAESQSILNVDFALLLQVVHKPIQSYFSHLPQWHKLIAVSGSSKPVVNVFLFTALNDLNCSSWLHFYDLSLFTVGGCVRWNANC